VCERKSYGRDVDATITTAAREPLQGLRRLIPTVLYEEHSRLTAYLTRDCVTQGLSNPENDEADIFLHDRIVGRNVTTAAFAFIPSLILDHLFDHREFTKYNGIKLSHEGKAGLSSKSTR
jgi:hypothetical protein